MRRIVEHEKMRLKSPKQVEEFNRTAYRGEVELNTREKESYYRGQLELEEFYRLQAAVISVEIQRSGLKLKKMQSLLGIGERQWVEIRRGHRVIPTHVIYRLSILLDKPYQEFFRFVPFKKRGILKNRKGQMTPKGEYKVSEWENQEIKILETFNEDNQDWQREGEETTESEI